MDKKNTCGCHHDFESHVDSSCSSRCECGCESDIEKANKEYENAVDKKPYKKSAGNNQW